ncbi:Transmembrane protein 65 [Clonorchis sinensis]|uniref:Transmembrane protein 65 n=1 Tax=Clonorchis sinensis TaxID=79923 RepID=A0A419QD36_CLOSI|nr:Transmembrane protein 65 [Clonorchis sinensis]
MNCTNTNKLMPHRPSRGAVSRVALPAVDSREPFARHMAPTSSGISRSAFKLPHPAYMAAFNLRTLKQARPQASLALTLDSLGIADGDRAWLKTLQDMAVNVVSGDLVVSFYPDCLSECLEAFIIIIMNTMCSTLMLRCRTNKSWLYGGKASMLDDVIMLLMMMFNDHVDDNAIMIIAVSAINLFLFVQGEYIDCTFSSVFGLSTMAAAGLGNWVSDLCGIGTVGYVERFATRLGFVTPPMRPELAGSRLFMWTTMLGRITGITIGCFLGLLPLLFFERDKDTEGRAPQTKS